MSLGLLIEPAQASTGNPPTNVMLVTNPSIPGDSIQVTWVAPGSSPIGYTVRILSESGGFVSDTLVQNPEATSTIVSNLEKGSRYKATVFAKYLDGTAASEPSSLQMVIGTPYQITAPPIATRVGVGSVSLNWIAPGNDGGTPITGFEVYCVPKCSNQDYEFTTDPEIVISGLVASSSYKFSVVAVNNRGSSEVSGYSNSVTPYAEADSPTLLSVAAGDKSVTARWEPLTVSGQTVTGYKVTVINASTLRAVQATKNVSSAVTSLTFKSLSNGSSYRVKIVAVTSAGDSPSTISSNVTPKAAVVTISMKIKGKKTATALAKDLKVSVPKKSKLTIKVTVSSSKICKVSKGVLIAIKKGNCAVTLVVQPPKLKNGKWPAQIKKSATIKIS